jgi:hypothetical protein
VKLTICECPCGCNGYKLNPSLVDGMFPKSEAEEIMTAVNSHADLMRTLRELTDCDGSAANVANAEILAGRVRAIARAAIARVVIAEGEARS